MIGCLILCLLIALATCEGACEGEQYQFTKFDDIKTDPFQKLLIVYPQNKLGSICQIVQNYSSILYRGLGVVTYILNPDEESEANLATLHYRKGDLAFYVQSSDALSVRYNGVLDPEQESVSVIQNNVEDFIEIRLTSVGTNLLQEWPVDGLEGVLDGGLDRAPALIGVTETERQENFIARLATQHKGKVRVYHVNCVHSETLLQEAQKALCEHGTAILFADHYDKYDKGLELYVYTLDAEKLDELEAYRWVKKQLMGKHDNKHITLDTVQRANIAKCMPNCGEGSGPLHASPKLLRRMVEYLSKRVDNLIQ